MVFILTGEGFKVPEGASEFLRTNILFKTIVLVDIISS